MLSFRVFASRARACTQLLESLPMRGRKYVHVFARMQVPGFSYFSLATREEVNVGDEAAFAQCKSEMLAPKEEDNAILPGPNGAQEYTMDITVKIMAASMHGIPPFQRTAEQNADVMRKRNEARAARLKDLEKVAARVFRICLCLPMGSHCSSVLVTQHVACSCLKTSSPPKRKAARRPRAASSRTGACTTLCILPPSLVHSLDMCAQPVCTLERDIQACAHPHDAQGPGIAHA